MPPAQSGSSITTTNSTKGTMVLPVLMGCEELLRVYTSSPKMKDFAFTPPLVLRNEIEMRGYRYERH